MSLDPRAIVLAPFGTNRSSDVVLALTCAGADPHVMPVADLLATQRTLLDAQMLVVAGGSSDATPLGAPGRSDDLKASDRRVASTASRRSKML